MDKKKVAIIASVALGVILLVGIIISNVAGIKQIKESVTVEAGTQSEIILNAKEFFNVKEDVAKKITFDTSGVDLTQVGEYKAVAKYNGKEYIINVIVEDTTPAVIADVADQVVEVANDKLSEQPEVNKSLYSATDNVDGYIKGEELTYELICRDEAKHEWLVNVSYVDRAGNESKAEFLIIVKEASTSQSGGGSSNNGGNSGNVGSASQNNGGASNSGSVSNGGNNTGNTNTQQKPSNNQDISTWVPSDDETEISPYMQMLIDAGYGNVVDWGDGEYGVLVHKGYSVNGKYGYDILKEYLTARGLDIVSAQGGIIDEANDWYYYEVLKVQELITPDEEEFWD